MKKLNKFSKLSVVFTAVYWLIWLLIVSKSYESIYTSRWMPKFGTYSIVMYLYLACIITATVLGIIAVRQTFKRNEGGKWFILLLTLVNATYSIVGIVSFIRFF